MYIENTTKKEKKTYFHALLQFVEGENKSNLRSCNACETQCDGRRIACYDGKKGRIKLGWDVSRDMPECWQTTVWCDNSYVV